MQYSLIKCGSQHEDDGAAARVPASFVRANSRQGRATILLYTRLGDHFRTLWHFSDPSTRAGSAGGEERIGGPVSWAQEVDSGSELEVEDDGAVGSPSAEKDDFDLLLELADEADQPAVSPAAQQGSPQVAIKGASPRAKRPAGAFTGPNMAVGAAKKACVRPKQHLPGRLELASSLWNCRTPVTDD